uniref:Response regulator n=1 Tax=candidate division CPR3 bacterium TaxID=2268181 RepID=A0A7C4M586_UNCC3
MIKILLVEDEPIFANLIKNEIKKERVTILWAENIAEAEEYFSQNPDISLIIMDANVPNKLNAIPLIKEIRKTFNGPIIAFSSYAHYNDILFESGCDYKLLKDANGIRIELWKLIKDTLSLSD